VIDANGTTTYGYDAVGNLETLRYPNGLVTTYTYNSINQLTNLTTRNAGNEIVSSYTYGLDATGRRETITDAVNGNYAASYEYDRAGNRTYETVNGVQTAYTYDNNDRLTQTGGTTYQYDNNGNTLSETLDANTKTCVWDGKNNFTSLTEGGNTTTYRYSAADPSCCKNRKWCNHHLHC
ncbi:MAG TPA: hypothetical protein VL995_14355, partial [Cellvibrio sp.]|nr:hypothetical protein [Cellvibrio sp.]